MSQMDERLKQIGFKNYADYLKSEWWGEFRKSYRKRFRGITCRVCDDKQYVLHHKSYENLGRETFKDVVPLCGPHHLAVHDWLKRNHKGVDATNEAIRFFWGYHPPAKVERPGKKQKKKNKKNRKHSKTISPKHAAARDSAQDALKKYRAGKVFPWSRPR